MVTPSDHHHVRAGDRHEDEQHLHLLRIGADPGHQLTDLGPVVVPEVQSLEVVEQAAAQLGFGPQRDGERRGAAEVRQRPRHECQRDDAERPLRERARVVRVDAVVDRLQREQRDRDLGERPPERGRDPDDDPTRAQERDFAHQLPAAAPIPASGRLARSRPGVVGFGSGRRGSLAPDRL